MTTRQILSSLSNLTDIIKIDNEQEFIWQVLENCISKLDLVDCVYYRIDNQNKLSQIAAIGPKLKSRRAINNRLDIQLGRGVVGKVGETCTYSLISDASQYSGLIVDMFPCKSELAIPVIGGNRLLGVIDSEHPRKNFFTEHHVDLLSIISKFIAPKLVHFKKKDAAKRDVRKKYQSDILYLLDVKKIYRNPELSLDQFAEILDVSPGYLCKIFENTFNSNYSNLINKYRVKNVIGRIEKGDHHRYCLIYLAFEAGYKSKSSFHYNFKKITGKNPSQYIQGC